MALPVERHLLTLGNLRLNLERERLQEVSLWRESVECLQDETWLQLFEPRWCCGATTEVIAPSEVLPEPLPWQELHTDQTGDVSRWFLVGQTSAAHWSACIVATAHMPVLKFELAARWKQPVVNLRFGFVPAKSGERALTSSVWWQVADPDPARLPRTLSWSFTLRPLHVNPYWELCDIQGLVPVTSASSD